MRRRISIIAILIAAMSIVGLTGSASAAGSGSSSTVLTGEKEVPGPGDDDGIGAAIALSLPGQGSVCIFIRYRGIDAPSAAHIHEGSTTVAGPVVIEFSDLIATSPVGQIRGCVAVDPALADDVAQNPGDFYVNVHNPAFPGGAIRGQLR